MRLVFLGAPGVGKGTQAALFCDDAGYWHISTGDLLRQAVKAETPLGLEAKAAMDRGDLVRDDVILGLIEETLEKIGDSGFVLDGFPRTLDQATGLDEMLTRREICLDRVVMLVADDEEIFQRLIKRGEQDGRSDDTPETVRHRLEVYEEKTAPLVGYYEEQGVLSRVDGVGEISEIQDRIRRVLESGKASC